MSRTNLKILSSMLLYPLLPLSAAASELRLEVTELRTTEGAVLIKVCDSADCWDADGNPAAAVRLSPEGTTLQHVFTGLAPGDYSVLVMHDENGNGRLDTNFIGIPKEGYGFSNNPSVMRKATFDEARFALPADGASVHLRLR